MFETEYEKFQRSTRAPKDDISGYLLLLIIPLMFFQAINGFLPEISFDTYESTNYTIINNDIDNFIFEYKVNGRTYRHEESGRKSYPTKIYYKKNNPKEYTFDIQAKKDELFFKQRIIPAILIYIIVVPIEFKYFTKYLKRKRATEAEEQQKVDEILQKHFGEKNYINHQINQEKDYTIIDKKKE